MRITTTTVFLMAYCFICVAAGAIEVRAFSGRVPGRDATIGLSLQSTGRQLRQCLDRLMPPLVSVLPDTERRRSAQTCARLASDATARMPTHGLAWLVRAAALQAMGKTAQARRLLAASARFAPFEGWLAERRFALAIASGTSSSLAPLKKDTATLLTTQTGAELLSHYYVQAPQTRRLIADMAGRASAQERTRLLNQLIRRKAGL